MLLDWMYYVILSSKYGMINVKTVIRSTKKCGISNSVGVIGDGLLL
jgi:hypothetical protein